MNAQSLGECLLGARMAAGMTRIQVGAELGLDRVSVFRHESNQRDPSNGLLARYCRLYDCQITFVSPGRWIWERNRRNARVTS
jgi:hypothetical protein